MHALTGRRGRAYGRDALRYLAIAAATLPFGVALSSTIADDRGLVIAASATAPALATLVAARWESREAETTPGKRSEGLVVHGADGAPPGFGRALVRNTVKIGLPWQLGHVVAVGAAFGEFEDGDRLTIASTALTYPLLGIMIAAVALGSGRGLHDRVAGTRVVSSR